MEFTSHEVTENSNQTDCLLPDQTGYFRSFQPAVDVNHDTRVHTAQIVIRHRLDQWGRTTGNKCSSPEYRSVAGPRLTINRVPRVIPPKGGKKSHSLSRHVFAAVTQSSFCSLSKRKRTATRLSDLSSHDQMTKKRKKKGASKILRAATAAA